jgi:hypothetical protein
MTKPLVRAATGSIALVVCLIGLSDHARAQGTTLGGGADLVADPFLFYYAFYLPNQQLQAMRSTPLDTINNAMVQRQYYAQTDRRGLYNPISPYADQAYDPSKPFSQQNQERAARPYKFALNPSNSDGSGPALYFNRTGNYHAGLREGRSKNANVYAGRSPNRLSAGRAAGGAGGGMGGGMGGMGGMGGGMGGMGGMGGGMGGMGGMM